MLRSFPALVQIQLDMLTFPSKAPAYHLRHDTLKDRRRYCHGNRFDLPSQREVLRTIDSLTLRRGTDAQTCIHLQKHPKQDFL